MDVKMCKCHGLLTPFPDKHALVFFHSEPLLEPVAFTEEGIIDIQAAAMHGFKITLSLCQDNIRLVQKPPRLFIHIGIARADQMLGKAEHVVEVRAREIEVRFIAELPVCEECASSTMIAKFLPATLSTS